MHVKHKRDDSKKARLCADGRTQRLPMRKDKTTSPTVCTDSVFITAAIEAAENRCIEVVDLTGAYLSADMDNEEEVLMVMRGDLAEMMPSPTQKSTTNMSLAHVTVKKNHIRESMQSAVRLPQISTPFLPQILVEPPQQ